MIVGLILAQVLTVGILVVLSNRSVDEVVSGQIDEKLDQSSERFAEAVQNLLTPVESVVELSAELAQEPGISPSDFSQPFISAIERSPQLASIFFAQPDGTLLRVSQEDFGYRIATTFTIGSVRTTDIVDLDPQRQVIEPSVPGSRPPNPTTSPWYKSATAAVDQLTWTDPYVFASNQPGITAAKTITRDGELIGVLGADVELRQISRLLDTLADEDTGAVIVSRDLVVIAHDEPNLISPERLGSSARPLSINELNDSSAQEAFTFATVPLSGDQPAVISYEDASAGVSLVASRPLDVGDTRWTLAVYGTEEALSRIIESGSQWSLTIFGVLSILGIALIAIPATHSLSELETRALTDPLTGLANRRAVIDAVREDGEGSRLRAVAMIDLDHFKRVNDTYGHPVGDQVLQAVAKRIRGSVRAEATVGRVGGEEFLVTFKPTSIDDAYALCERIRLSVASTPISTTAGLIDTTASIGLATTSGPCRSDRLMFSADMALLQAKEDGRNRVVAVELGPNPGPPLLSAMTNGTTTDPASSTTRV